MEKKFRRLATLHSPTNIVGGWGVGRGLARQDTTQQRCTLKPVDLGMRCRLNLFSIYCTGIWRVLAWSLDSPQSARPCTLRDGQGRTWISPGRFQDGHPDVCGSRCGWPACEVSILATQFDIGPSACSIPGRSEAYIAKSARNANGKDAMAVKFVHFTSIEKALAIKWRNEGKSVGDCAKLLGRNKEAVREHTTPSLVRKKANKKSIGRPRKISEAKFQNILAAAENMVSATRRCAELPCWQCEQCHIKRRSEIGPSGHEHNHVGRTSRMRSKCPGQRRRGPLENQYVAWALIANNSAPSCDHMQPENY